MSVLIKGMEMPQNCYQCSFRMSGFPDWCDLPTMERNLGNTLIRPEWCPLVEIPPHGRLIDADALPDRYAEVRDLAPTIIESEDEEK